MYKVTLFTIFSLIFIVFTAAQTVPPAPADLTVEPMGNYAHLTWQPSSGASGYRIYKALDALPFIPIAMARMPGFVDQFVPPGHIYRYYVTALNYLGESEPSNDVTFIPGSQPPARNKGIISGAIIDDFTQQPIRGVRVRFFTPNGFVYFREARTDSNGYYSMPIDSGVYLVFATKWTYIPEWYDNVLHHRDATPVSVMPRDTSVANFGLTRIPPPPPARLVAVSGTVIDSATGDPIKGAFVVIMRSNRQVQRMQYQEGSLFGSRSEMYMLEGFGTLLGVMRVVRTDSNGNYLAHVPDSLSYIILAAKLGYIPEFYNNKSTPYDADRLFLVSDTSNINFDLVSNPEAQNSVAGMVKNLDGDGVLSKVVLFKKTPRGIFPIRSTITDSLGNYSFNYIYTGYHFAKAYPLAYYAPAWYDVDSCGITCWVNADSFLVTGATTGIDICVQPILVAGFASISGSVRESAQSSAINGVTVYAVSTASNAVVGYDITEDDGTFDIHGLAPGSYKLVVDKENYSVTESSPIVVDGANNYTASDMELYTTSLVLVIKEMDSEIPQKYSLHQNYPNPFNPTTEISFNVPTASEVNISIYNVLGQQVITLVNRELNAGSYSISWNGLDAAGNTLSSGVYFYKINANALGEKANYTSVRKMMMMK